MIALRKVSPLVSCCVCGFVSADSNGTDADLCKMAKTETSNLQDRLSVTKTQVSFSW